MSVGNLPSAEYLIETVVLGSNAASVTFSNLAQYSGVFENLNLVVSVRSNNAQIWEEMKLTFNSSASGYRSHLLGGTGSSVFGAWSDTVSTYAKPWAFSVGANATADTFGAAVIEIANPFSTGARSIRTLGGRVPANGETRVALSSAIWQSGESLNSITIAPEAGSQWLTNSRFSLYGVNF
jgi:hypothetical protein